MDESFIGTVMLFAGNFAPLGWAYCDGTILAISSNTALFSLLGTTYGGDGKTTFALPDLRGRVAIGTRTGSGLSSRRLGEKNGEEQNVLTIAQMPNHTHLTSNVSTADQHVQLSSTPAVNVIPKEGDVPSAASVAVTLGGGDPVKAFGPVTAASAVKGQAISATDGLQVLPTGGNLAVTNMQPWLGINYIIALQGLYPSRN